MAVRGNCYLSPRSVFIRICFTMKIEYTSTKRDIWQYHWYLWRRRSLPKFSLILLGCLLTPCLNFIPGFIAGISNGLGVSSALGTLVAINQIAVLMVTMISRFRRILKSGVVHDYVVEIGKFDFYSSGADGVGYYYHWSHFAEIVSTKYFLYFMLKGDRGLLIPKSAFSDASEATKFYEEARAKWELAHFNERHALMSGKGVWPPPPRIGG